MKSIKFKLKYSNLHWEPCSKIVQLANEKNIVGYIKFKNKKANINSIISLFLLFAKLDDELELFYDCSDESIQESIQELIKHL
jgi:phosphotransferase system HPr-like phosphotransfer protein